MKKYVMGKNEFMAVCDYTNEEFTEMFGDECMGVVIYEDEKCFGEDVTLCISQSGQYVYYNMGMEWRFNNLNEFEKWYY